jgi:hypothetical protein
MDNLQLLALVVVEGALTEHLSVDDSTTADNLAVPEHDIEGTRPSHRIPPPFLTGTPAHAA